MAELCISDFESARPINSETFSAQTYNFLLSAILKRELKEGVCYSQDHVSSMLGISRTPVREALLALQKEGYIRFLRGRGFEVIPYDEKDIVDIFETRMIVEKAAASLAASRASEEQLTLMEKNIYAQKAHLEGNEPFDIQYYLSLDDEFHQQILNATGNICLTKVIKDIRNQWLRAGYSILQYNINRMEIFEEHMQIFEAMKKRDTVAAEQAMVRHIRDTQIRRLASKQNKDG